MRTITRGSATLKCDKSQSGQSAIVFVGLGRHQRRIRGLHTGASAKGWDWKRPELDRNSFVDAARLAFDGWRIAATDARNDFAVACLNGPRSDVYDFELI